MGGQLNKENLQTLHQNELKANSSQLKTNSTHNKANQ
jgi:hypothetical protein